MTLPAQDATAELHLAPATQGHDSADLEKVVIHLFDETQARLSSYVLAFGLPLHDAEDVVQDTFLSLFHHLKGGRPRWNLNGWLFRVAHNLALKRRTANQTRWLQLDVDEHLSHHPDPAQNAEEQLAFIQTQQRLRAAFEALPERDRCCLHLRAEGLNYRDIAKILGISLGSVSLSLSRSLARMSRASGGDHA